MASSASLLQRPDAVREIRRVLLATDFSSASENAVRCAAAIAGLHGAKLYLAHVVSSIGFKMAGPAAEQQALELAERDCRELEMQLASSGILVGCEHQAIVLKGGVWEQLQRVVEREAIDLLVVGTHGRSGLGKLVLGSEAEEIFRAASCPVLTVGPCCPPGWFRDRVGAERVVLFATDFGPACDMALPYVTTIVRRTGAKLMLLHVQPLLPEPTRYWYTADDVVNIQNETRSKCVERLKNLIPPDVQAHSECRVEFGGPTEAILDIAASGAVDLVVLGLQRTSHRFPPGHLPGAIAYGVVCGAKCPVLTVRA